jgi:proteasome activator subunit 4
MVYSMAVDGPIRSEAPSRAEGKFPTRQVGYLAGSKAMESLDKFITSTESFFHPSNSGVWSLTVRHLCCLDSFWLLISFQLTQFLRSLTSEFCKRWHEEELPNCKTPPVRL